jgi:hypothetical protein
LEKGHILSMAESSQMSTSTSFLLDL